MATTRDQARGAMLGTFLGDALGAPWEGTSTAPSWQEGRRRLERSLRKRRLLYTDDTQMMLALAEHLTEHSQVDIDELARQFVAYYEEGRGYGPGTIQVIEALSSGTPVDQAARAAFPDGSLGNGAAMRVAPVGVRWAHDPDTLAEVARRSALPTHVHPEGIDGAMVIAAAVGRACSRERFTMEDLHPLTSVVETEDVARSLHRAVEMGSNTAAAGDGSASPPQVAGLLGVSATAARSVAAALWIAAVADDASTAVSHALALGGDADTIAAMALAVVGAAHGQTALPRDWLARCEDGVRGRSWCEQLADALTA